MKIIIKEKGKKWGIRLWFPTWMLFSKTSARLVMRSMNRSAKKTETIASKVKENVLEEVNRERIKETILKEVDKTISAGTIASKVKENVLDEVNSERIRGTIRAKVSQAIRGELVDKTIEPTDEDSVGQCLDEDPEKTVELVEEDPVSECASEKREKTKNKKPWDKSKSSFPFGQMLTNLPEEKVFEAMRILRGMRKNHPGVPLVDVRSANGDRVLIKL
ncbi:MAG TPA: hypothetical protein VFD19_01880 [Clostridia bacterium]|nr:hypothetical protein [Clostridia bacterium]